MLPDQSAGVWLLVVLGALVVGLSKAALPGAGTIAAGLFALALPAKESTAALLLLLILGDVMALAMYRREPDARTLVRLIPSVLVGLLLGAGFLAFASGTAVRSAIGIILLVLVAVTLWRRRRRTDPSAETDRPPAAGANAPDAEPARTEHRGRASRIVYGGLGGFTTMVANAGGPVMSLYFLAVRMPVLTFLGTSAWFFATVNILKLPFSIGLGLFTGPYLAMDLVLAPLVVLGALAGRRIATRLPQNVFEWIVLGLTVVSAVALLV